MQLRTRKFKHAKLKLTEQVKIFQDLTQVFKKKYQQFRVNSMEC
jgi:hypothetical protein